MIGRPPRSPLFPYTPLFRSMVCTSHPAYDEAARNGWFNTDATGRAYQYRYSTADQFQVSHVDFTNAGARDYFGRLRSEEHTSELQSRQYLVCRLLLEKKKTP